MELTGPEKAVLMLLSLDESVAVPVMAELDASDIRKLRDVASMMREVPASALDSVYTEFIGRSDEAVAVPRGGERYLKRIAARALGEQRSEELFFDGARSAIERIAAADPVQLGGLLEREHPQLIAALVSQLHPGRAAEVLAALPDESRPVVLERLANMTEVPAGLLEEVAAAVTAELPSSEAEASVSVDGLAASAAVVRKLGRDVGQDLLARLEEDNSDLAVEIRKAMYSFEDLRAIEKRAMRELLKEVPSDRLALALKTASDELKEHFLTSMSKRAAQVLTEDMELLGAVRLAEVEAAQHEIVEVALRLEASGVLSLDREGEALV